VHYWLGVVRGGGPIDGDRVRVLCWHSIADLSHDPVLSDYGVPPATFNRQIAALEEAGWAFLGPDEFLRFLLSGAPVPRRSVLLTFDDGYADLVSEAEPVLTRFRAPAVAFAVSGWIGRFNRWDVAKGRTPRPLAGRDELMRISHGKVEIGSHTRSHPRLTEVDPLELGAEVVGSRRDLLEMGFAPPRLFAYPYGAHDRSVHAAVRDAGYTAAFTTEPRIASRSVDPFAVPRIEVWPHDVDRRLLVKVRRGERRPGLVDRARLPWRAFRRVVRWLVRPRRKIV
jgi:peptidoglycan/xylan/chitin deacetylase (PgdA/CDA1 family)